MLLAIYFAMGALAIECKTDGNHTATCASRKCEVIGQTEVCTQCKAGGVPIDGLCRPASSPQATAAGCTGSDGAALTGASTVCGMCSGGFFLFRGGCYSTKSASGGSICTKAEGGKCTACNVANGLFKNPAASPTLGGECILCWDTTGADKYTGVENCQTCTAPNSAPGTVTCNTCKAGFSGASCTTPCGGSCASCDKSNGNTCTSCSGSKYLKDSQCVEGASNGCGNGKYADPQSNKCLECGIADCATCEYDAALQGPKCLTCTTSSNMIKTEVDGTTTCVAAAQCAALNTDGTHFLNQAKNKCLLCSDITTDASGNGNTGVANCKTCQKANDGTNPTCSECLDGYFFNTKDKTCTTKCADNCATCSEAGADNKCSTCMVGFFLVGTAGEGQCVPCGDTAKGGIDGCADCDNKSGTLKCTKCKANYNPSGEETNLTCTKFCEDPTACGGTAGSCKAAVLDDKGVFHYYCSLCGDSTKIPIDGKCVDKDSSNQGNTDCTNGACPSCKAANYFLYMGGCYKLGQVPGSYMCTDQTGSCTTTTSHYFLVPGVAANQQSVLGCGNPLGTNTTSTNAYVGVEGCRTCEAPTAATGMAAAKCTACDEGKALTGSGYGCVTCDIAGCSACRADSMCEACGDGYRLEGGTCVRTGGGNLSTGAIAGISVAAVVVVGGLVGFLCWWFICRGKA